MQAAPVASSLTPFELHLHAEGTHHESYRMLGSYMIQKICPDRLSAGAPPFETFAAQVEAYLKESEPPAVAGG